MRKYSVSNFETNNDFVLFFPSILTISVDDILKSAFQIQIDAIYFTRACVCRFCVNRNAGIRLLFKRHSVSKHLMLKRKTMRYALDVSAVCLCVRFVCCSANSPFDS